MAERSKFVAAEQEKSKVERKVAFEEALKQKQQINTAAASESSDATIFQAAEQKICDWGRDSVTGMANEPDDLGEGIDALVILSDRPSKPKVFHGPIHPPEDIEEVEDGGRRRQDGAEDKPAIASQRVALGKTHVSGTAQNSQSLLQNLFEWSDADGDGVVNESEYKRLFELLYQANTGRTELESLTPEQTEEMLQIAAQEFEHDSQPQPAGGVIGLNKEQFDKCFCQLLLQGVSQTDFEAYLQNVLKMTLDHQLCR
jgi:hypothetical protein